MTKARFYIKGKVQDIGYRPYIMKEIIKREGLNGIADNHGEDSVEVLLEGEENKILVDFYDFLKKEENKPREAEVKEISELEFFNFNSTSVHVPKASEYSQALTFEQLGKGIPILKGMSRSIEGMSTRVEGMHSSIEGMSTRVEGMDENISGMREEMREGFDKMSNEMRGGFDKLPKEIAKELRDLLEGKIRR